MQCKAPCVSGASLPVCSTCAPASRPAGRHPGGRALGAAEDGRIGAVAQDQARCTAPGFPARLVVQLVQPLDSPVKPLGQALASRAVGQARGDRAIRPARCAEGSLQLGGRWSGSSAASSKAAAS